MIATRPRLYVPFERTGRVRKAFASRGWYAVSCDLQPTVEPCGPNEYHHVGDARELLGEVWDLMIAFPVCTFTCNSGIHWNARTPGRAEKTEEGVAMFREFHDADIPRKVMENPMGIISTRVRPYDQTIHPYQFGHDASKETCLWLYRVPPLRPTKYVPPRIINGKPRWANQTDSGQNKLSPSPDRGDKRAETYPGIADAMGDQWHDVLNWTDPQLCLFA